MDTFVIIILRAVHILVGVFWAGATFILAGFLEPTARALGPDGGKFMQRLSGPMRLTQYILIAALLNVLSGIWLYWSRSGGFQLTWIATGAGITLTIGGVTAIITAVLGFAVTRPTLIRMGTLGQEIQAGEGPPKPEHMAEMQVLQLRLAQAGRVGAVLLVIAVVAMAVARYV